MKKISFYTIPAIIALMTLQSQVAFAQINIMELYNCGTVTGSFSEQLNIQGIRKGLYIINLTINQSFTIRKILME